MPGIDDPLDAVKKQYPERSSLASVLIDVGSELHPFASMVNAVRNFFSKREAEERVKALLQALEWYVRQNERRIEDLSDKINAPEFIETLLVAADKTLHTANVEKIKRFARVLGHELISDNDTRSYEDAATYIRTLSELGEADIETLSLIHAFQIYALSSEAFDSHKSNWGWLFWGMMKGIYGEINRRSIHFDEFRSRCARLNSYGLLHRVSNDDGSGIWMKDSDDAAFEIESAGYLLARKGKKLIEILGSSPELLSAADEHRKQVQAELDDRERHKAKLKQQPRTGFAYLFRKARIIYTELPIHAGFMQGSLNK
jgi:hypothetical protein